MLLRRMKRTCANTRLLALTLILLGSGVSGSSSRHILDFAPIGTSGAVAPPPPPPDAATGVGTETPPVGGTATTEPPPIGATATTPPVGGTAIPPPVGGTATTDPAPIGATPAPPDAGAAQPPPVGATAVQPPPVGGTPAAPAAGSATPAAPAPPNVPAPSPPVIPSKGSVAQPTKAQLTAPDGFVYDFKVTDEDYVAPLKALPYGNMTNIKGQNLPASVTGNIPDQSTVNPFLTWRLDILNYNKELWQRKANRKIEDAVTTLMEQADIYMDDPVFLPTNKSFQTPATTQGGGSDPRLYFSLSDYYWPFEVSPVNPDGVPYKYDASVNPEVYDLTPNKLHLELTIDHVSTLALAWFFSDNAKYAERAREKAYVWFLDPTTSMLPSLRVAAAVRGETKFGRPQGIYDMAKLPSLLNAVTLLESSSAWSPSDSTQMHQWVGEYINFLENEPVARYARRTGNYIATNFDEQLLAAYIYQSSVSASALTDAAKVAHFSEARQKDQIVNGQFIYERNTRRSLDFTQQCLSSWVNIAIMSERLGLDLWNRGLGEGYSVKDAFDFNRPYFETLGETWPFDQVGTPRVRIAGQLLPSLYVGYRLENLMNTGPVEYIELYEAMWPTFNTQGSQARGIIERLPQIELDSILAEDGIPLIEECDSISCDSRTLGIWGATLFCLFLVSLCLCWNCFIHWRANRATDIPQFLQHIREQQAKYKNMNLKVVPAKPEFMLHRKEKEQQRKMEEKLAREEEKKHRHLKQQIKETEEKLQRRRESKMASQMSQMQAQYSGMVPGFQPMMPGGYTPSMATQSVNGSSFFHQSVAQDGAASDVGSNVNGSPGMPGFGFPTHFAQPGFHPGFQPGAQGEVWPYANLQAQVIPEEANSGGNEFSFPGTDEPNPQEFGTGGPEASGAAVTRSASPLSSNNGPSQSLTGLLAGANDLLGEINTSTTQPLGSTSGSKSQRMNVYERLASFDDKSGHA